MALSLAPRYLPRSPRSVYWRAIRRVERRAAAVIRAERAGHAFQRAVANRLLRQAVRLANRLAMLP